MSSQQFDLEDTTSTREYYTRSQNLWLPPRAGFRQFRFFLGAPPFQRVVKIKDRVRTVEILRKWLVRLAPYSVYYTTSTWLDSENLGPKDLPNGLPGYHFSYNVFLSQELYFDIDVPGDLEEARKWTSELRRVLRADYGFKDLLTVYSGNKGFHIHVYDFDLANWTREISPHPAVREMQTQEAKAQIVNQLMHRGLVFDADVTVDTRRMIRLPGTVNGKTLNICEIVHDIDSFRPQRLGNEDEKLAR